MEGRLVRSIAFVPIQGCSGSQTEHFSFVVAALRVFGQ